MIQSRELNAGGGDAPSGNLNKMRPQAEKVVRSTMSSKATFRACSLLLSTLLYFGCTTGYVPATGERRYLGYTWQQETEIGKQASKQIAAVFGLYHDAKLERYVSEVGN